MAGGGTSTEELNLVPYLDVMVNLIMFMIVLVAYLVELKETPVLAPSYCDSCGDDKGDQPPFVTVAVTSKGYKLIGGGDAEGGVEIPKRKDGQYDTRALTASLKQLKVQIPKLSDNLVLMADGTARYEEIILTMDAARFDGSAEKILFNGITFAKLVE